MNSVSEQSKPWYREFWAWFVFTPLIVVVIACSFTVTLAFKYKDDVVDDDYYKVGKMINQGFEPDQQAKALGLSANMRTSGSNLVVELNESEWQPDDVLIVALSHPFEKERDAFITLLRDGELTWAADVSDQAGGKWYVKLSSIDDDGAEQWRLHGEVVFPLTDPVTLTALVH